MSAFENWDDEFGHRVTPDVWGSIRAVIDGLEDGLANSAVTILEDLKYQNKLEAEIERLSEYEWMYKELCE